LRPPLTAVLLVVRGVLLLLLLLRLQMVPAWTAQIRAANALTSLLLLLL
jgi:hypothetical protein